MEESRSKLRRLIELAKPEWKVLALATIVLFAGSSSYLAFPQAVRVIVDEALGARSMAAVDRSALILFAVFGVQGIASGLRYFLFTLSGERIVKRLQQQLYARIITQEIAFFDERRTGELMNRISADCAVLQSAVSVNVSMALRNALIVIGGITLLFWISATLALVMLAIVPPVAIGAVLFGRRVRRLSRDSQDALAASGMIAEETISGIRTVRAFAQEQQESRRFGAAIEQAFVVAKRRITSVGVFSGGASVAGYGALAAVLWFGGRQVISGGISVGDLTSFMLYTLMVAVSLGALSDLWADFMRASGAADRVFELLDRSPRVPIEGGRTLEALRGALAFEGVAFRYPSRPDVAVLSEVTFHADPGRVIALVGPSGAGKSTIAALVSRFYDVSAGRILLDGVDLRTLDPTWLRRQIGVVSQEPLLMSTSIAANIRYGCETATDQEVELAARTANAHDFISALPQGYATEVGERGLKLSGGQKQRVAIARALLKNPRILILDEATSALDAESEHLVKEALERLQTGRTTLVIAHRLSTVIGADQVLVLDAGRLTQAGTHRALMDETEGLYRRLIERQFVSA